MNPLATGTFDTKAAIRPWLENWWSEQGRN